MRLSDAEWTVMEQVWRLGEATARDVHDGASPTTGWAYTTVKTMLDRLVEKGAVAARLDGNALRFRALLSRDAARRSALRSLLDHAFGGSVAPLLTFLAEDGELSARERRALRKLLDEESAT